MTPPINPAFARFVVKIEPELPKHLVANKYKLANLAAGKTTSGNERKKGSRYTRRFKRKVALALSEHPAATPAR